MPEKTDAFRANVGWYCRLSRMTQAELAQKAGLSQERLSKMLSGKSNPTLPVCERIACALKVSLEALLAVPAKVDLRKRFGELLRARRKQLGLTQAEVAERAGMQPGDLCKLENGRHAPTLDTVERLAVSLDLLLIWGIRS